MADIELTDLKADSEQSPGTPFPVSVSVENNETVAPAWGAEALCSDGVLAPDGHKVDVTFTVRGANSGDVIKEESTQVCATVEQPSNVLGDTRAEVRLSLPEGRYTVEAYGEVPGAGGSSSAQPKSVTVTSGGVPEGDEESETDHQYTPIWDGLPTDGNNNEGPDLPTPDPGDDPLGLNPFGDVDASVLVWVLIAIAALWAFGQGFDVDLGSGGTDS